MGVGTPVELAVGNPVSEKVGRVVGESVGLFVGALTCNVALRVLQSYSLPLVVGISLHFRTELGDLLAWVLHRWLVPHQLQLW